MTKRRTLLKTGLLSGLALATPRWARATTPNNRIQIGIIGCGGMGMQNMRTFLSLEDAQVTAVCDVDKNAVQAARQLVNERYNNSDCAAYSCHRDMLEKGGLDAVCISTPDHWHAAIGIDAAQAGCDIYGEKPFTWGLAEGRLLIDALTRHNRIWQTGSWQRSANEFRRFHAIIRQGVLGRIDRVECGTPSGMSVQQHVPAENVAAHIGTPPPHLDWEAWCGPAGETPYHPLLHPWNWRWHTRFGGGQLLDWVGHHVDIAMWALDLGHTGPVEISGSGSRVTHDFFDVLDHYQYTGTFANGTKIEVRSDFLGTRISGENGWIHVDRGRLEASDPALIARDQLPDDYNPRPPSHWQDFLNAIRSRGATATPAECAHRAASFGMLAMVAIDLGRTLKWNPEQESILGDDEAATHPRLSSRIPS